MTANGLWVVRAHERVDVDWLWHVIAADANGVGDASDSGASSSPCWVGSRAAPCGARTHV